MFEENRRIHLTVDAEDYELLAGEMLAAYQAAHPGARFSDVARHALHQSIERWLAGTPGRQAAAARRERRMRRLGEQVAAAPAGKVEQHARRLAELVEEPAA